MKRFCLALDLRPDKLLIQQYIEHHRNVPPLIQASIRDAGILDMQIYRLGARLFMIMDVQDDFSFERKAEMDLANPAVRDWEELMSRFQDVADGSDSTKRWQRMDRIFKLEGE